jgi:hypothetical protein
LKLKLAPGLIFFIALLLASVAFGDLLTRIEESEDRCMELRIEQAQLSVSLRLLPLVHRLDEIRKISENEIGQRTKEGVKLANELKAIKRQTEAECSEVSKLKRFTAFVQAIVTALLALVGLFAGFWLAGRKEIESLAKPSKRQSHKSRKKT